LQQFTYTFNHSIHKASKNTAMHIWLSNALLNNLTFLNNLASEAINSAPDNESIIKFGSEKSDLINAQLVLMQKNYFKDLMELDDIKKHKQEMDVQAALAGKPTLIN
jgi:hypothetical protein